VGHPRSLEAEPHQDATGLMRREICAIEPGRAGDHLLWRIPSPVYDHVVLPDRIGKLAADGVLDPIPVELEVVPRDRELCHVANRIL
jgi:hypothetical protein